MKKSYTLIGCLLCTLLVAAQAAVRYRVILIGDAGTINPTQQRIISDAVHASIPGKTLVLFLGDNVYPKGVELTRNKKQVSFDILRSQFEPFRKNHIPVYFVPGNHDWDKSGIDGYEKMQAFNTFISDQHDSLLQVIPSAACPGPYALSVNDKLLIVAMDSEWWLYPHDTHTAASACACKTKEQVLDSLAAILERNADKAIIFATHHPFITYGSHGGYYSLREHLFPLTDLNKYLFVPLPVIGSLYPLVRKAFPPPEDLKNHLYQDMKQRVNNILKKYPNVIHVAGHEHTLQLIEDSILQVVSGAGCQFSPVKKGKGSLLAKASSGYVLADLLENNDIRWRFFADSKKNIREVFVYLKE